MQLIHASTVRMYLMTYLYFCFVFGYLFTLFLSPLHVVIIVALHIIDIVMHFEFCFLFNVEWQIICTALKSYVQRENMDKNNEQS